MSALRRIGRADCALLAELHAAGFPEDPWSAESLATLLAMPGAAGALAVDADGPAGFALWRVAADEAEIVTLCIRPAARRRGHARALMEAAMASCAAAGARRLILEVAAGNAAAESLYGGLGFRQTGRRPAYYRRIGRAPVDALLLEAALDSSGA